MTVGLNLTSRLQSRRKNPSSPRSWTTYSIWFLKYQRLQKTRYKWLICILRLPYPWRQFDATLRRVLTDTLQYINQESIWINVLQLAGRQQTLNDADPLCSNFRQGKQPVAPTQFQKQTTACAARA